MGSTTATAPDTAICPVKANITLNATPKCNAIDVKVRVDGDTMLRGALDDESDFLGHDDLPEAVQNQ